MAKIIFRNQNLKSGQTLVELLVAIGLIAMVVTALLVLVSAATKVGISSLKRSQATKIATLALESVRYYRDKDSYDSIPGVGATTCFSIPDSSDPGNEVLTTVPGGCGSASFVSISLPDGNVFQRQIMISAEDAATHSRDVTVQVRWAESIGTTDSGNNYRQVILSTSIAEW